MDQKVNYSEYSIVLLAAGYGSRISGFTDLPKCLLELHGRTLLERNFDIWHELGIKNINLVLGYKKELIIEVAKKYQHQFQFNFIVNEDYRNLGNTYSLKLGIESLDNPFLIFDADLVYEKEILLNFLEKNQSSILIGPANLEDIECAKALADEKNFVRMTIDKRAVSEEELKKYRFVGEAIGILKFSKEHTTSLKDAAVKFLKIENNLLKNWEHLLNEFLLENDVEVSFFDKGKWVEIDNEEDFIKAEAMFDGI